MLVVVADAEEFFLVLEIVLEDEADGPGCGQPVEQRCVIRLNCETGVSNAVMIFLVERCHGHLQILKNFEKIQHTHEL